MNPTQVYRGDFQVTTGAAGTVLQIRGLGFQPKVVLFEWNGRDGTSDIAGEASYKIGYGWTCGATSRRCVTVSSLHAGADAGTDRYATPNACIATITPGTTGVLDGLVDFNAWDADGFDLIIDDQFAAAFRVHFLAIGGVDVQVAMGTFTSPGAVTIQDVTGLGFQPQALLTMGWDGLTESSVLARGVLHRGFASGPAASEQFVSAGSLDDATATSFTTTYARRGEIIANDVGVAERGSLAAWLPDGFQLSYAASDLATYKGYYLALRGARFRCGSFVTSVTNGATLSVTGVGFLPKAGVFISNGHSESALGVYDTQMKMSVGLATAISQSSLVVQDQHSVTTMDTFSAMDFDKVLQDVAEIAAQVIDGLAALTSFDADGATLSQTDGTAFARWCAYFFIGDMPVEGAEDEAGILYRGAQITYTDSDGFTTPGMLESSSATYGNAADVAVLRANASGVAKVSIAGVPHKSATVAPPYWLSLEGERTAPPILLGAGS